MKGTDERFVVRVRQQQCESVSLSKAVGCNAPRAKVLRNFDGTREVPAESVEQHDKRNGDAEVEPTSHSKRIKNLVAS